MRVFVAGASGVIGRPLVAALNERGHEVSAMTRSESKAAQLHELGARGVVCDVYDTERLAEIVAQSSPDVVVHQLTALPKRIDPRKLLRDTAATNRIRTEGTDNLLAAATKAGARRFVAQSIAFAYGPSSSPGLLSEDVPLFLDAPGASPVVGAVHHLEQATLEADLESVVLRYGFFYGPETVYAAPDGSMYEDAKKRRVPIVGKGRGQFSFVHLDDAVSATVTAIESDVSGIFNVVEDEPAATRACCTPA